MRRVPSGNMTTISPSRQNRTAVSIASRSAWSRRTGKPPPARTNGFMTGLKSSDLAMKRRFRRGKRGIPSGQGSKFELWFAASTQPPLAGTFSAPRDWSR